MFAIRNGAGSDSVDGRDGSVKRSMSYLVKSLRAGSDSVHGRDGSLKVETFDIISGAESESRKRQRLRKGWIGQSIKTRREIKEP